MGFRSLSARIIVFFVALLALVQMAAFIAVNLANSSNAHAKVESELDTGQRIFQRILDQNNERLAQAAQVLAADFGFREAVATHDVGTLESALQNSGTRIGADAMLFVGLDGRVTADTLSTGEAGSERNFELPALIDQARSTGRGAVIQKLHGNIYQLLAVSVRAPLPIGWVVLGFAIDDELAHDLKQLATLDVTFLADDVEPQSRPHWRALASTLAVPQQMELDALLPAWPGSSTITRLTLNGDDQQVRVVPLNAAGDLRIVAVLQRSMATALAAFDRLRNTLFALAAASLLFSVLGCLAIALNITRPLGELVKSALRIRQGDYGSAVPVKRYDEIGTLADSLDHMRNGIAEREAQILRLAYEDHLTGLPNRSKFGERLTQELALAQESMQPLSILVMDLDRFKNVNDTLGHGVGDHVLREVAVRISALAAATDCVARLGGDEFAVLLPQAAVGQARKMAMHIITALEEPILYDGQPLDVGTSIGVAQYPDHGTDAETLVSNADVAMYVAKRSKSGHAVYDQTYDTNQQEHLSLLGELRRAVEQNELRLCYQPKMSLDSATITEVEALLRWVHPVRGLVPPGQFIPFAEQTGYIKFVTHWVLREAIRQCGTWKREGLDLRTSINISARDLMNRELPEQISTLLREFDVPAHLICLEITESGFMDDPVHAQQVLNQLAGLGLNLSIDDYGTGYSSLSYIMKLPVNELKIDRSFIASMVDNADISTIVRSTIDLGHNLGLKVVAEGVETAEILALLRQLGCDLAQGFYVSAPLYADDLLLWLRGSGFNPSERGASPTMRFGSLAR
ncbi:MAG: EAL domain-containing protein [Steroidobacteraceae bacterium]